MSAHTSTTRGKRVIIITKAGIQIPGKFLEKTNRHVILDTGPVLKSDIRAMVIDRSK